jgi:subtilisin family serine protease
MRKNVGAVAIVLSFLVPSANVYAQHSSDIFLSNGKHLTPDKAGYGVSSLNMENAQIVSVQNEDPEEVVRLIVSFKDQPLSVYMPRKSTLQKTSISSVYSSMQTSHASFRTALTAVRQQLSARLNSDYSYTITREYYRALNGVALQCKRGMIERVRALPMVRQVSLDREVNANLKESVHQIRADIVQDSLGFKGDGVLVGDIDTGIDYDNPALGGGFGPAFRVIGGYDFVNNDSDPMDDEGHGTHVAGIIGANGGDSLRGVAPHVRFLAVKVLDAHGEGWASDIIAGIEYCLDPDNNPETDDGADVINMSLGGVPSSDSPLDSAVDNATKAGLLCVVAAGNSAYLGFGSIQSPGTSESALTVGATVAPDAVAGFSSLGPDPIHSSIKPEVVAPGVLILSTVLNNQTASWSGTSMAAAHVTGVAALLKQEHPLWTPDEIKAAIINSAHSVGDDVSVFAQGRGCVDALDAANARLIVEPGVISYGMVDLTPAVWMDTVRLAVRNFHSISYNIRVSAEGGVPAGTTLTFDKTTFSLAPGEETTLLAVLTVSSSVPVLPQEPFAYFGTITVSSDSDNIVVPFSFIKSTKLVVTFDIQARMVTLLDRTKGTIVSDIGNIPEGAMKFSFTVPKGDSLDILALLDQQDTLGATSYYIVDHPIDNAVGLTYVPVSYGEATLAMIDTIYDIHNTRVTPDSLADIDVLLRMPLGSADFVWGLSAGLNSRVFISRLDSSLFVEKDIVASRDADLFILRKFIHNLRNQKDISLGSGAGNLAGYHLGRFSYDDAYLGIPPSSVRKKIVTGFSTSWWTPNGGSLWTWPPFPSDISTLYVSRQGTDQEGSNDSSLYASMFVGEGYWPSQGVMLRTPDFSINANGEAVFEVKQTTPGGISTVHIYETVKSGDTIQVEHNAHCTFPDYMAYIRNGSFFLHCDNDWSPLSASYGGIRQSSGVLEWRDKSNPYWMIPLFTAQAFTHNRTQTNAKPFLRNQSILYNDVDKRYAYYEFDNMNNRTGTLRILSDAPPYTILGQAGQCTADCEYQVPGTPIDSTVFASFNFLQVAVDGRAVDVVRPGQNGTIRLVLFDPDGAVTSARISVLPASGDEIDLPVSYAGDHEYDAGIPASLSKGFFDVVASAADSKGNTYELTASPAFYSGSTADSVRPEARVSLTSYALNNVDAIAMQSGDTLNYALSYTNYGTGTARNIVVALPSTPYFRPIGEQSRTIDSLAAGDTARVPARLQFLGKQQSTEKQTHYTPSVTWTSGGTTYLRKHAVLVDFQNTVTGAAQTTGTDPNAFALYQNYPNPFNPSTTIRYDVPKQSRVTLEVYDILGRKLVTLVDESKTVGSYQTVWNASRFASGVYFYRLQAGGFMQTMKLALIR